MTHADPYSVPPGALTVETITYHGSDLDFVLVHAYEMTDTQFKYKCSCKKGFHCHGNGGDPFTNWDANPRGKRESEGVPS